MDAKPRELHLLFQAYKVRYYSFLRIITSYKHSMSCDRPVDFEAVF